MPVPNSSPNVSYLSALWYNIEFSYQDYGRSVTKTLAAHKFLTQPKPYLMLMQHMAT